MSNYCEILCTLWWALGESTMELETMDAKLQAVLELQLQAVLELYLLLDSDRIY